MQSISHRSRRIGERIAAAAPRQDNRRARVRRTSQSIRRGWRWQHDVPVLDLGLMAQRQVDACVQALGCLVWAAAAREPRLSLDALCDAASELFEGMEPEAQNELAEKVLRMSPEQLAERGEMIAALASAPARAARYVELAEIRYAHQMGGQLAGRGSATDLASRAVVLVLDPLNSLGDVLPLAVELASRAAAEHDAYAPLAAALTCERERHEELGEAY